MNDLGVLLLGLGLGLRHATDADHVVVLSALLQRERGALAAVRLAMLWGAGHTLSFLAVGLSIVLLGLTVPPALGSAVELLVAAMLIGLGARALRRAGAPAPRSRAGARPLVIGVVHGLAGSAVVALLAATTVESRAWAALYLGVFSLGTVLGMALLTLGLSFPIGWTVRRAGRASLWIARVSGAMSVGLGVSVAIRALVELAAV